MARGTFLLGWLAGGTGIVLIYSAYKNTSPVDVLRAAISGDSAATPRTIDQPNSSGGIKNWISEHLEDGTVPTEGSSRAAQIKARTIKPTLVPVPTQPNLLLDRVAAMSFMQVQADYGRPILLTGTYRSREQQEEGYERNPGVFGTPGTSLHEVGLAVDVSTKMNLEDPKLIQAFQQNGWYRRGKVIDGKPEAWHWTYGVPG